MGKAINSILNQTFTDIELVSGEYIAIMDDDDIAPLNRLEYGVK